MRKLLFLVVVILVGFAIDDMKKEYIVLDWSEKSGNIQQGKGFTAFLENPGYPGNGSELPLYTCLFDQGENGQSFVVQIVDPELEETGETLPEDQRELIPSAIRINSQMLKSGDSYKTEVTLIPIIQKDGKIFRLKSFQLKRIPVSAGKSVGEVYNWKTNSVLSSGKWVKISTDNQGIYRIPYSKLRAWGFSQPEKVNVYGSGGLPLSENPGQIDYDDLDQCAVWRNSNGGEECLFFYAPGVTKWQQSGERFIHKGNNYSVKGYFFLGENSAAQKTPAVLPETTAQATHNVNTANAYALVESELYNLLPLGSGKQWFGEKFGSGSSRDFSFSLSDPDVSTLATLTVNAAARSYNPSSMALTAAGTSLGTLSFSLVNTDDIYGLYADSRSVTYTFPLTDNQLKVNLKYQAANTNAEAWLDYLELNYRRKLNVGSVPLFFRDLSSLGAGNVVQFSINNAKSATKVFDVTNTNNVLEVPVSLSGSILTVRRPADDLREYVVFNTDGSFNEPEFTGDVENQNLHGLDTPEYLIIAHANFMSAAEDLAEFHREYDGMNVEVVDAAKVYNEFSSGSKDATGIRNFIKMFYDRGSALKFVLLFGDGSYDNKGNKPGSNNLIPTFQSDNSLITTSSFVTDDYYVMLDNGESVYNGAIDLGIGRLPVATAYEAQYVVDKIRRYHQPEAIGNWRNVITFIGDDEDSGLHMRQSEELADSVNENNNAFVTDKIYFDAYVQQTTPSGDRYPGVNSAINERVKDGVLILNYTGHANERFLAHEHVLDISDINSWSNTNNLPIFVTATCEFSRFDADETSAGEYVLLNPNGGGIGLFSTTRVVYASANFQLSKSFYSFIFKNDASGNHYRMGDVMRLAKTNIGSSVNKRNFSLLADPALRLSFPKYRVITTKINQKDAGTNRETIGALEKVTVEGYVADVFGNKIDGFNGTLIPTVFDKEVVMETLGNDGDKPIKFKVRENVIYKGESSVNSGNFSFSFVVPKDISYSVGQGKIVYYADNGTEDAHGAFENFEIGGTGNNITDNQGPDIRLYMDSRDFQPGDETGRNTILLADISDENGINTVGTGIGHDITAVIDNDYSNVYVLNSYYKANNDDYTSGTVSFPLKNLSIGKHRLILKAWDVANNSSEQEIEFEVTSDLVITDISNYPNPVNTYTYFVLKHNQPGSTLDVIFDIYDKNGRSVDRFQTSVASSGNTTNPVRWDLAELNVAATPGVYIYRAIVQNTDGVIASKSGKMIVVR